MGRADNAQICALNFLNRFAHGQSSLTACFQAPVGRADNGPIGLLKLLNRFAHGVREAARFRLEPRLRHGTFSEVRKLRGQLPLQLPLLKSARISRQRACQFNQRFLKGAATAAPLSEVRMVVAGKRERIGRLFVRRGGGIARR